MLCACFYALLANTNPARLPATYCWASPKRLLSALLLALSTHAAAAPDASANGFSKHAPPPPSAQAALRHAWRPGCPVAPAQLALLEIPHWGYDGRVHHGRLFVHRARADEVLAIFRELFALGFPIEQMRPIDAFDGDDERSMRANNTSAFNCRHVTGGRRFSRHSYGVAVDINPRVNPYINGERVLPVGSARYAERTLHAPGMIVRGDAVYRAFTRRGWTWGGDWRTLKDYQHFEKPLR